MAPAAPRLFARLRAHPHAVPRVAAWLHEAFFHDQGLSLAEAHACLAARLGDASLPCAFVALQQGEPVGTVSLVLDEHPLGGGPRACLAGLYVPPAWRGRGLGTWMCRALVDEAAQRGHASLMLFTPSAEGFYARAGWHSLGSAAVPTAHGLQWCVVMASTAAGAAEIRSRS